jgi:hypothetical protein
MKTQTPTINYSIELEVRFLVSVLLSVSMYFIAASIGSGWVLFLAASVLAYLILSMAIPLFFLSQLRLSLLAPDSALAGEPIQIRPLLTASSKFAKEYCKLLILNLAPDPRTLFKKQVAEVQEGTESILIESISTEAKFTMLCHPLRRGKHKLPPLEITSSFPFGLAWVIARFHFNEELIVLPRTVAMEGNFIHRLKSSAFVPGDSHSTNSGFGSSASRGVRNYVRGDSRRHIHWNLSARHGQLMVKERENEGMPSFDVVFDAGGDWQIEDQFDLAITTVASILKYGNTLGIHPELFILDKNYQAGQPLPERIVELDQQLIQLACLEMGTASLHTEYGTKKGGMSAGQKQNGDAYERVKSSAPPQSASTQSGLSNPVYSALLYRPKAVVIVAPSQQSSSANLSQEAQTQLSSNEFTRGGNTITQAERISIDPRSRGSMLILSVMARTEDAEQVRSGDVLSCEQDVCLL